MAKYKVELEFDVNEKHIGLYYLGYNLERNRDAIINTIFEDWNDDDSKRYLPFVPDSECSYKVVKVEDITNNK